MEKDAIRVVIADDEPISRMDLKRTAYGRRVYGCCRGLRRV